jgi:RNA polymerase sigma-70 factor (ECF subfamily)
MPQTETEDERSICLRFANRIRAYGLCHLRDRSDAEDLVQQVLVAVLQALRAGKVKDVDKLESYVFGTCRNMVIDMRRGTIRRQRISDETRAAMLPEGYEPPWSLFDRARLDACLEGLEERARSVVLATFIDEREADEIGRSLSLTAGNVRVIRHRALAQLQQCMVGACA